MYFVSEVVQLKHLSGKPKLSVADNIFAHAAIMDAISQQDAKLGRLLHDLKRFKHLTVTITQSNDNFSTLRLTFMSKEGLHYATLLSQRLLSQSILQLGSTRCEVITVDVNDPIWGRVCTWADLTGEENPYLHFQFLTPTAITQRSNNGTRFMVVFPEPIKLFSGLAKRWANLSGPPLPCDLNDFLLGGGCVISSYRLRTVKFQSGKRTQIGFVGMAVFECLDRSSEHVAALNALTKLAYFSGVGYQTARGMGAVLTSLGQSEDE